MTLLTLSKTVTLSAPDSTGPFIRSYLFTWSTAAWWEALGAPHEEADADPTILDVTINGFLLTKAATLAQMEAYESTWYYDQATFTLYIHYPTSMYPYTAKVRYGKGQGFSDGEIVYIDNTEYLPYIQSAPRLSQKEDVRGYSKPAFYSGNVVLSNVSGALQDLQNSEIIGNTAILSYLPDDKIIDNQASSGDLVPLATYFVESLSYSPLKTTLRLQDPRKVSKQVPDTTFNKTDYPNLADADDGKTIPLIYGTVRAAPAIATEALATGSTSATYRAALLLTAIAAVQVKIGDTWVSRTPSSVNLSTGTFVLPNARASATEAPYLCRVDCTGVAINRAIDIITDLYNRYLGDPFGPDTYDVATWSTEQFHIGLCSLYLGSPVDIYTAINQAQNAVYPGFRFLLLPDGRKSIKADYRDRPVKLICEGVDLQDLTEVEVEEVVDNIAAQVVVKYDRNHLENTWRTKTITTYATEVFDKYQLKSTATIEVDTTSGATAQSMGDAYALANKEPERLVSWVALGDQYLDLSVYDVVLLAPWQDDADLYNPPASTTFVSPIYVQLLEVKPNLEARTCALMGRILDRVFTPLTTTYLMGSEQGLTELIDSQGEAVLVDSDSNIIVSLDPSEDVVNLVDSQGYFILGSD